MLWFLDWGIIVVECLAVIIGIVIVKLPYWETTLQKLLSLLLCGVIIALPLSIYVIALNNRPVQTAQVEVVGKRTERYNNPRSASRNRRYVTFKFPDGSEKETNVDHVPTFNNLQEGDTGTLFYKQTKNTTGILGYISFEGFEKDEP